MGATQWVTLQADSYEVIGNATPALAQLTLYYGRVTQLGSAIVAGSAQGSCGL